MKPIYSWLGPAVVVLSALHLEAANPPKILIIYDMEGISGVVAPNYERFGKPEYQKGRDSLTEDVNAAIRGLKAGGAGAIWIEDGHGSGNSQEPDILVGEIDRRANFDFRDLPYDPYSTGLDGSIDAIVCIGMHARARTNGFLAHTFTFDVVWNVNGVDITETHIVPISASRWGIPIIMVSGDDVLARQLPPDFPELEYATVKTAKSLTSAEAVPRAQADERIENAARKAMQKFLAGAYRPYYMPAPYDFRLSFRTEEQASLAAATRGVARDGNLGVRYGTPAFIEGYDISKDVIGHGMNPMQLLVRLVQQQPDGAKILQQWRDLMWQQIDPSELPSWALPPEHPQKPQKYYGDR